MYSAELTLFTIAGGGSHLVSYYVFRVMIVVVMLLVDQSHGVLGMHKILVKTILSIKTHNIRFLYKHQPGYGNCLDGLQKARPQ